MERSPLARACIAGVYVTEHGDFPERSVVSMMMESLKGALEDSGLRASDIDGLVGAWPGVDQGSFEGYWAHQLGVALRWHEPSQGDANAIVHGAGAIAAGLASTVVVLAAGSRKATVALPVNEFCDWTGVTNPAWHALYARLQMDRYGTTSEQMAEVAVAFRRHALLHEGAWSRNRGPIAVRDVLASPMVADPLRVLDCSRFTEGGLAVVLTSSERARELRKPPVRLLGAAERRETTSYLDIPDPWIPSGATHTGQRALELAGLRHEDIDVLETYDAYTITVLRELEDLGFCKLGEGGAFVAGGALGLQGRLPTNTHGGLLSFGHMGTGAGGTMVVEAVRQLRGEAGARQVAGCRVAMVHNQYSNQVGHATLVLGRD